LSSIGGQLRPQNPTRHVACLVCGVLGVLESTWDLDAQVVWVACSWTSQQGPQSCRWALCV